MYMQNDIAAAAPQGPHFRDPKVDPVLRRAEIDEVIAAATAAMPKATMRKLVRLSFASAADDDDHSSFGQIRSEPIGASGLEFRFPMPARDTGRRDLDRLVTSLVEAAVAIARASSKLTKYVDLVREAAEEAIGPATGGISAMRVVAIGVTPELPGVGMRTTVDVEMLGCDLRPGVERATYHDFDGIERRLKELALKHVERRTALAQARVAGATGWIDDAVPLIAAEAGIGLADLVSRLRDQPDVEFYFGGEEGYDLTGAAYWVDGTIRGFVEDRTRGATFRLQTDQLTIEANGLPATIVADLVGRRLREVVDLRFIPTSALIVDVHESGDWLYLDLEIGRSTVEGTLARTS